jgi:hypothetical protein
MLPLLLIFGWKTFVLKATCKIRCKFRKIQIHFIPISKKEELINKNISYKLKITSVKVQINHCRLINSSLVLVQGIDEKIEPYDLKIS